MMTTKAAPLLFVSLLSAVGRKEEKCFFGITTMCIISKTSDKRISEAGELNMRGPDSPCRMPNEVCTLIYGSIAQSARKHQPTRADRGCIQFCHPLTLWPRSQSLPHPLSGLFCPRVISLLQRAMRTKLQCAYQ